MPNLYGVSNPVTAPTYLQLGGPVTCTANVETLVWTSAPLVGISSGFYYPVVVGNYACTIGATAPGYIQTSYRIGAGADWTTFSWQPPSYVANGTFQIPVCSFGPTSSVAWLGAGSTVSGYILANAQAVTIQQAGTYFNVFLFRAPDQ